MLGVGVFKSGMCGRAVCWAFWVPFHVTARFFLFLLLSTHQLLHIHIPFFFFFQLSGMLSLAKCLRGFMRGICPCGGVPPLPHSNSSRLCCRQVPQEDVPSAVCYQNMNLASIMGGKNLFLKNESLDSPHNMPITISNPAVSYWEPSCSESHMILERKSSQNNSWRLWKCSTVGGFFLENDSIFNKIVNINMLMRVFN